MIRGGGSPGNDVSVNNGYAASTKYAPQMLAPVKGEPTSLKPLLGVYLTKEYYASVTGFNTTNFYNGIITANWQGPSGFGFLFNYTGVTTNPGSILWQEDGHCLLPTFTVVSGASIVRPFFNYTTLSGPRDFVEPARTTAYNVFAQWTYDNAAGSIVYTPLVMASRPNGINIISHCVQGGRLCVLYADGVIYTSNTGATDFTAGGGSITLVGSGANNTGVSFTGIHALDKDFIVVTGVNNSSIWRLVGADLELVNVVETGVAFSQAVVAGQGRLYAINGEGLSVFSEDVFKNSYTPSSITSAQNEIIKKFYNGVRGASVADTGGPLNEQVADPIPSDYYLQSVYSATYNALFFIDFTNRRVLYVYLGSSSTPIFCSIWTLTFNPSFMKFRGLLNFSSRRSGGLTSVPMIFGVEPFFNQRHYLMFLDTPEFRAQVSVDQQAKLPLGSGFPNFYNEEAFTSVFDTGSITPVQSNVLYSGLDLKEITLGMTWERRADYDTGQPVVTVGMIEDRRALAPDIINTIPQQPADTQDVLAALTNIPKLPYYRYMPDSKPVRVPYVRGRTDEPRIIVNVADAGRFRVSFGSLSLVAKYSKKRKDTTE
jgi:hypothetical protein